MVLLGGSIPSDSYYTPLIYDTVDEVGSSSHYLRAFIIPGGAGFLPSTVQLHLGIYKNHQVNKDRSSAIIMCFRIGDTYIYKVGGNSDCYLEIPRFCIDSGSHLKEHIPIDGSFLGGDFKCC